MRQFNRYYVFAICVVVFIGSCRSRASQQIKVVQPNWSAFLSPNLVKVTARVIDDGEMLIPSAGSETFCIPVTDWVRLEQLFMPGKKISQNKYPAQDSLLLEIQLENRQQGELKLSFVPGGKGGVEFKIGQEYYTQSIDVNHWSHGSKSWRISDRSMVMLYAVSKYQGGLSDEEAAENNASLLLFEK